MPMIPPIVDHAFCINLDHRRDRWVKASQQFDAHDLAVERFSAIDGRAGVYGTDLCDNYNNACTLSHLNIIQRSVKENYKAVLIFEDDVLLNPLFARILTDTINDLPANWDMLYLGGNHRERPVKVTQNLFRATKVFTTHAYIIRSTVYNFVIDRFPSLTQPVDCYYCEAQKIFNCYICNPRIAYQAKSYSDILHKVVNYKALRD